MLETPEARAELRQRLETWRDEFELMSPMTINQGLELLDMVDRLENEETLTASYFAGYRDGKEEKRNEIERLKVENTRLEKEAEWLAMKLEENVPLLHEDAGWRESAHEAAFMEES